MKKNRSWKLPQIRGILRRLHGVVGYVHSSNAIQSISSGRVQKNGAPYVVWVYAARKLDNSLMVREGFDVEDPPSGRAIPNVGALVTLVAYSQEGGTLL